MQNNSRFFFILLSVSAVIGIGNIWLYPYFLFKYSSLFILSYTIALILLSTPIIILEFSIGQYFNKNIIDSYSSIRKWLSFIGWFNIFNSLILMSIYSVIISWHIIYFFVTLGLQWKNDSSAYFFEKVIQVSSGFNKFTEFSLPVFVALIIAWIIIFFYIVKGFESLKKSFLITSIAVVFFLLFFFAYTLSLDNAIFGIHSFIKPKFNNLLKTDFWINSFSLALISLGLSFGVMPAFSRKSEKGFIVGNSLILAISKIVIGTAIAFITFSILGFLGAINGDGLSQLSGSSYGWFFTTIVKALPFFYKPTLLSALFFLFFSIFFIFGAASLAYSIQDVLVQKLKTKQVNGAIIVSGFGFLFGLLFVLKPGFYIMDIVLHFLYYNILFAVFLETIAIGWWFDLQKISDFIDYNSSLKLGVIWKFLVKYITPLIVLFLIIVQLHSDVTFKYMNYPLKYILMFGAGALITPLIISILMPRKMLDKK